MSDLTKLTAEELITGLCGPTHGIRGEEAEITRRLERLETAEATAQAVQNELALIQEFLREAKERLEQCEADYKRCCELNERMAHEVHDLKAALEQEEANVEQLVGDVRAMQTDYSNEKKMREQCEAAIRELLCWFGPGSAASLGAKCETLQEALDAARAAVEE